MPETIDHTDIYRSTDGFTWPPDGSPNLVKTGSGQSITDTAPSANPANAPFKTIWYKGNSITTPSGLTVQHKIGHVSTLASGVPLWGKNFGGINGDGFLCCATDSQGNIYAAGNYNPWGGIAISWLVKLSPTGTLIWEKTYYSSLANATCLAIAVDGDGNVVFAGSYSGQIDFDGNILHGSGTDDIFVAKIASDGTYIWAKSFGSSYVGISGNYEEGGYAIAVDTGNNVIVSGSFYDSMTIDGAVTLTASPSGQRDIFLAKFSSAGVLSWAKRFGSQATAEIGRGLDTDASGNIVLTGTFALTANFGGDDLVGASGVTDIFVAKFDSSGNHIWSKRFGGNGSDSGQCVSIDSLGNVIVGGYFRDTATFEGISPNPTSVGFDDIFLMKLSGTTGAIIWLKTLGGFNSDDCAAVAIDQSDNIYITGKYWGAINFGANSITAKGAFDPYVAKFDTNGVNKWAKGFGSEGALGERGLGIAIDLSGMLVVVGVFGGTMNLENGTSLVAAGQTDGFVLKLRP